jgi:hypothetical protein
MVQDKPSISLMMNNSIYIFYEKKKESKLQERHSKTTPPSNILNLIVFSFLSMRLVSKQKQKKLSTASSFTIFNVKPNIIRTLNKTPKFLLFWSSKPPNFFYPLFSTLSIILFNHSLFSPPKPKPNNKKNFYQDSHSHSQFQTITITLHILLQECYNFHTDWKGFHNWLGFQNWL